MASPNSFICSPKAPMSFVPNIAVSKPPAPWIFFCISESMSPALAADSTAVGSIAPLIFSEKDVIASAKESNMVLNLAIGSEPKDKKLDILERRSAAVTAPTTPTTVLTPSRIDPSPNVLSLFIPDSRFSMKPDILLAISGRPELAPAEKPPTKFPRNDPNAYAMVLRTGIPF